MKKIGLVSALAEESKNVLEWLGEPVKTDNFGQLTVNVFNKYNFEIYAVSSGAGEIIAAAVTQLLICVYKVELIINFGLVGSLSDFGKSEMCVVSSVVHYDYDVSSLEGIEKGRYSRFPSPLVDTDKNMLNLALKIDRNLKSAVLASGDKFISDKAMKENLRKSYGADICDMEGAGVLFTAITNNVPSLIIKVVSDTNNHEEEFHAFLERNDFKFVGILEKLFKIIGQ